MDHASELSGVLEKVRRAVAREGRRFRRGSSQRDIDRIESRLGVRLPSDIRQLYQELDGLDDDYPWCGPMLTIWRLESLGPACELAPAGKSKEFFCNKDSGVWIGFADYLLSCDEFAFRADVVPRATSSIWSIHDCVERAGSLSQFLALCLEGPDAIDP